MQSQTLTGTDPLPLLLLLQTRICILCNLSFCNKSNYWWSERSTPYSFSHPLVQSVLFHMHVCLYIFDMNGKGQNLQKSVLVFQWPLEWQAQQCTTSPRSWEVSHFVYVVEISWISNNFVVGWLKSVKNLMCFIYNLLHRFVCWDHNVKQKYIQGHYNHEGVLDGK